MATTQNVTMTLPGECKFRRLHEEDWASLNLIALKMKNRGIFRCWELFFVVILLSNITSSTVVEEL